MAAGGLPGLVRATATQTSSPQRAVRARWPSQSSRLTAGDRAAVAEAEHAVGDPAGETGRAAAPHRARAAGDGRRPAGLAVGHLQDQHGRQPTKIRAAPAAAAAASPSKVSAALMSRVTLASAVSMAAVRSARCLARE